MTWKRKPFTAWLVVAISVPLPTQCFLGDLLRTAFGSGSADAHTTPVAIGVQINRGDLHVLIPRNTTCPARQSYTYEDPHQHGDRDLEVRVFVGHSDEVDGNFEIGRVEASVHAGVSGVVKIETALELDSAGKLKLQLQDVGSGRLSSSKQIHNYQKLAVLFAPAEETLRTALTEVGRLDEALAAEKTENGELIWKIRRLESDLETQGKELWTTLRQATDAERVAESNRLRLVKERDAHASQRWDAQQEARASEQESKEIGAELWEALRATSAAEKAADELRKKMEQAQQEAAELSAKVDQQARELEERGQELWSCLQDATVNEVGALHDLEAVRASAQAELGAKASELEVKRAEAWWWSVVASVVAMALSGLVFSSRHPANGETSADGATAKRERQRLRRLLARVRQEIGGSPSQFDASLAGKEDRTRLNVASRFHGALRVLFGENEHKEEPSGIHCNIKRVDAHSRRVTVQCPGVLQSDVEIEVIFNGALISIRKHSSPDSGTAIWSRRVQFAVEEGCFELKDEETRLQHGVLEIVFRAHPFRSRLVKLPEQFDLSCADLDLDQAAFLDPSAATVCKDACESDLACVSCESRSQHLEPDVWCQIS